MRSHRDVIVIHLNNEAYAASLLEQLEVSWDCLQKAESSLSRNSKLKPDTTPESIEEDSECHSTHLPYDFHSKNTYIFQRLQFDEGFSDFASLEPAQTNWKTPMLKATVWYNCAQIQIRFGALDKAISYLHLASESIREEPPSRIGLLILSVLGQVFYRQGRYQTSCTNYKKVIDQCKTARMNDTNTDILSSAFNCLSVLYYHMMHPGNKEEYLNQAIQYARRALVLRKKIYGAETSAVATNCNNLGRMYAAKKDFCNAIRCYRKALVIRKKERKYLDYAASSFNIGQSLHQTHDLVGAMKYYKQFLNIAVNYFTTNHRDVASALCAMALIHQQQGEYDKALKLYKESLKSCINALGEDHIETTIIWNRLGEIYFSMGNYDAAFDASQRGLECGTNNNSGPNIASLFRLGEIYTIRRQWHEALITFQKILTLQQSHKGNDCDVAAICHAIGMIHHKRGFSDEAIKYLEQALRMFGGNSLEATSTMVALGVIFYQRGDHNKTAMDLLQNALSIRRRENGAVNNEVALTLYNIALVQKQNGSYTEAIFSLKEALRIQRIVLVKDHKDIVRTLCTLGQAYKEYNEYDFSLHYFLEALKIQKEAPSGSNPKLIANILIEVGEIHLAQGSFAFMMDSFLQAERTYQKISVTNRKSVDFHYICRLSLSTGAPAA